MPEVDIEKIIPVTEARDKFNQIVDGVENSDELYVLTKNGKPTAVVVGVHHLEKITGTSHKELMGEDSNESANEDKPDSLTENTSLEKPKSNGNPEAPTPEAATTKDFASRDISKPAPTPPTPLNTPLSPANSPDSFPNTSINDDQKKTSNDSLVFPEVSDEPDKSKDPTPPTSTPAPSPAPTPPPAGTSDTTAAFQSSEKKLSKDPLNPNAPANLGDSNTATPPGSPIPNPTDTNTNKDDGAPTTNDL